MFNDNLDVSCQKCFGDAFLLAVASVTEKALKLQRPLPDGMLKIVAIGEKEDHAA
jgi:hypothetical protein